MMLKGLQTAGTASARLPSTRPVPSRRHVAFKGVRPSVRVLAADAEPQQAERKPRGQKREAKPITVQIEDLKEGDELEGTVVTVEDFGAFVDFGARVKGMIHVSKLAAGFVKNARDVVQVGQVVGVKVLQVDAAKGRVSLALKGADAPAAAAADVADEPAEDGEEGFDDEDGLWGVDLEEGQSVVYTEVRGFEDVAVVVEENAEQELTEADLIDMEADLDAVEVDYQLDAPAYLTEVSGKVTRIEDFGLFVEFSWEGQLLSGLLAKEELKVPVSLLSAEKQAAVTAEWSAAGLPAPAYVALDDEEFDIKSYYKVNDTVAAFILDPDLEGRGIALTHFTDEEITSDAVAVYEGIEDDEELLDMLAEDEADAEEVLALSPEELLEEEAEAAADAADASVEDAEGGFDFGSRASLLRTKGGDLVSPLGLPSRPLNAVDREALNQVSLRDVDFDGDEIELDDFWSIDYQVPKKALAKVGLKMTFNEAGEPVFEEREDFNGDLPVFSLSGDVSERAAAFVEDLLSADDEEEALPARAGRRPIVLAAAVSSQ